MKVLAWNLQHGGGSRIGAIAGAVAAHTPDVAIFSEYRAAAGRELRSLLSNSGYRYAEEARLVSRQNGVAVISRWPLERIESCPFPVAAHRWIEVRAPAVATSFVGFYGPLEHERFDDWWKAVRTAVPERLSGRFVLAGDFNTGMSVSDAPRNPFYCANHFEALQQLGMQDAWRSLNPEAREYSWYSMRGGRPVNGFRLDHALISPPLAGFLIGARYSQAERENGLSDHAPLIVDFKL